jgi:ketosteroid isomerase-like protein
MENNKDILIKANEAVAQGDNEGFLAFCTEDTKWNFIGDITLNGKDAVRQYMVEAYLEPPKFDVANLIEEGNMVVAVGVITMKDKNGVSVESSYADVWRFENGKMAELNAYVVETGRSSN